MPLNLKVDDQLTGHVVHIAPFGAFIELDNADGWQGLVRIPEISWLRIRHPSDVLTIGQQVQVQILHLAPHQHQISLSIKRCFDNPWEAAAQQYTIGQTVEVLVTQITAIGAWAHLQDYPAVEGLLPLAEMGQRDLSVGQVLRVSIAKFEPVKPHISFQIHEE